MKALPYIIIPALWITGIIAGTVIGASIGIPIGWAIVNAISWVFG